MTMTTMLNKLDDLLQGETPYHFGRMLYKYTDCGPWIVYLRRNEKEVYYESEAANHPIPDCVGVKVGSIVEGSDEGIDPVTLLFPFTLEQFDETVREIDEMAALVWDWANVPRDRTGRKNINGKTDAERGYDWPLL